MKSHARKTGFVLLSIVTAFYFYQFIQEDWRPALETWYGRKGLLMLALLVNATGILMSLGAWLLVYLQFGMRPTTRLGLAIHFTVYAAQVIPLQLGRLVRCDAIRLAGLGELRASVRAEASLFYLELVSLLALLGGLAVYLGLPILGLTDRSLNIALGLAAYIVLTCGALAAANLGANVLSDNTRFTYPPGFWLRPSVLGAFALRTGDWCCAALVLYVLTWGLPGELGLPRIMSSALLSTLVGSSTGLPGGMGATEGVLGWLLGRMQLPMAYLVISIGAYRLITFWAQVPVGWAALVWVNRRLREKDGVEAQASKYFS